MKYLTIALVVMGCSFDPRDSSYNYQCTPEQQIEMDRDANECKRKFCDGDYCEREAKKDFCTYIPPKDG